LRPYLRGFTPPATPEFKQSLIALCQPGISISGVTLAHGVNANLLRRWINQYPAVLPSKSVTSPAKLVPIRVNLPAEIPTSDVIEISIQKGRARVSIRWPCVQAHACGQWLADWIE
jgi:transposase-like protein